ncbi:extracellular solute-binding protein [Streptomyces sp.]|uniref:extracellular solute-binding protein n=1 Tax=Streptomyces sp. TaxID=1931 RepID=UPI002F403978
MSKDTTLRIVATDYSGLKVGSPVAAYWGQLASGFEQRYPHIKIEVQFVPVERANEEVAAMVKAGNIPDMAQLDSYSGFAAEDRLYSADALFPISMQSDFIPSLAKAGSVKRTQYGIPWVASTRMLFYNKKLFAEAGIKKAPRTWAEIKRAAVKLKENGVPVPFGLPLGPQESEAETMLWMLGNDGGYTDASGAYTFDSASNVKTFTWLKNNLVEPGLVGPNDPARTNVADAFGQFLAGRTGMLNGHMTVLRRAKGAGIDIGVAPLPGLAGLSARTLGNADWIMAFKEPGHLEADAAFMRYVYSPENMLKFHQGNKLLPVTADTSQAVRSLPDEKVLLPFLQRLPDAAFFPVNKPSWVPVSAELRKNIGRAVHGDPKSVLTNLQSYAESVENTMP